jgi:hypothetical protein
LGAWSSCRLATATTWSFSRPGTRPTGTTSSLNLGEPCASHRLVEDGRIPRSGASQPDANTDFLPKDLCRMSLAEGKMPTGSSTALPLGVTPPPPGPTTPARGTTPSSAFPFGLDSVARVYASSVSTSMSAYEELTGHHLCSTLDLVASTPASEYLDSMETPETEPRATASQRYNPRDR